MQLIYELCIACAVLMLYRASHRRELALYNELKKLENRLLCVCFF